LAEVIFFTKKLNN